MPSRKPRYWPIYAIAIVFTILAAKGFGHWVNVVAERRLCFEDRIHSSSSIEYGPEAIEEECRELHRFFYLP